MQPLFPPSPEIDSLQMLPQRDFVVEEGVPPLLVMKSEMVAVVECLRLKRRASGSDGVL